MSAPADTVTLLIAEDQEHVREALAMLLRGYGYSVVLCASPADALAAARENPPELALLDMNYQRDSTSGIEGLELIQALRRLDATIPIIALTAWGNVDLAVSAMKHGANRLHRKAVAQRCAAGESRILNPASAGGALVATGLGLRASGRTAGAHAHCAAASFDYPRGRALWRKYSGRSCGRRLLRCLAADAGDAALLPRRCLGQGNTGRADCGDAVRVGEHVVVLEQQSGNRSGAGGGHAGNSVGTRALHHHFLWRARSGHACAALRQCRPLSSDFAAEERQH